MQRREEHSENDQRNADPFERFNRLRHMEFFQNHRRKFKGEHGRIEHHAPGYFEHHRTGIPHDNGMPDLQRTSEIEHQSDDDQQIAEKCRENGGPNDRFEPFYIENINDCRERKSSRRKSDAAENIESDPDSPRKPVGQVC